MHFSGVIVFFSVFSHWFFVCGEDHRNCIALLIKHLTSLCPTCSSEFQENEPKQGSSVSLRSMFSPTNEMFNTQPNVNIPSPNMFGPLNYQGPVLPYGNIPMFQVPNIPNILNYDMLNPQLSVGDFTNLRFGGFPNQPVNMNGDFVDTRRNSNEDIMIHPNWKYFDRENCGESISDRIIGGKDAALGQYPWLAVIGYESEKHPGPVKHSCGAALINTCWVLTAGHCTTNLPEEYHISEIRLGEHNLKSNPDCDNTECSEPVQIFKPAKIIAHENYPKTTFHFDIALIKLDRPVQVTRWVSSICLPHSSLLTKDLRSQNGEIAGWGLTNADTKDASDILQTVTLPIIDISRCDNAFRRQTTIDDSQICVGGVKGLDSCNGDSGGPMMKVDIASENSTPKYYAIGVVSFGVDKCGEKPLPSVLTSVPKYMKWILDHVSEC